MLEAASIVILADPPTRANIHSCVQLFHELGHTTKYSFRIKYRPLIHLVSVTILFYGLGVWPSDNDHRLPMIFAFMLPIVPWLIAFFTLGLRGPLLVDEVIADRVAVEFLTVSN